MSPPAPPNSPRRLTTLCAGLFAGAAAVRILFLFSTVDRVFPFSVFYYGDSRVYREFALALLRGEVFDQGIPYHPPGFAWVLAAVIRVVGERPTLMRGVLATIAALAIPLAFLLGTRVWDRRVALTGALIATFSFGACVAAVSANTETIYVPILTAQVLAVTALAQALASGRGATVPRWTIASGALLGVGALARAEHLGFVWILPLALVLASPRIPPRRIAKATLTAFGVAAVILLPWIVASARSIDRFQTAHPEIEARLPRIVPVSGYGPLNFALANHEGADGAFRPDALVAVMGQGRFDFTDPRQVELYVHGYRAGLAFLIGHPGDATRLVARKLALTSQSLALGFGASDAPAGLRGVRRPVDVFVPDRRWFRWVALALLVTGAWASRRSWRRGAAVWLSLLHVILVSAAFFGYARLALHVGPLLSLVAAAGLVDLGGRVRAPAARRAVAAAGWVVVAALFLELVVRAGSPTNLSATGSIDPATGKIIQDSELSITPVGRASAP